MRKHHLAVSEIPLCTNDLIGSIHSGSIQVQSEQLVTFKVKPPHSRLTSSRVEDLLVITELISDLSRKLYLRLNPAQLCVQQGISNCLMASKWTCITILRLKSFTCSLLSFRRTYSWVKSIRFCRSMSSRYARMLLLMNRLSWSLIQSLNTNAKTPVVNSKKKMIPRNTENYSREEIILIIILLLEMLNHSSLYGTFSHHRTYKLEKKCVFPQCSNASSKAQNEHDPPDHHEKPDWVQTSKVCDGWEVGKNPLKGRDRAQQHPQSKPAVSLSDTHLPKGSQWQKLIYNLGFLVEASPYYIWKGGYPNLTRHLTLS